MRTIERFGPSGQYLTSRTTLQLDGSSDSITFGDGGMTRQVLTHVDGSKDVFQSTITGKDYVARHISVGSDGRIETNNWTMIDGSHEQRAYQRGAPLVLHSGVADTLRGVDGTTFLFGAGSGDDTILSFWAGASGHSVIEIDYPGFADVGIRKRHTDRSR